jgi:hypothetical protein
MIWVGRLRRYVLISMQNKAKLGRTGACGQGQSSYVGRLRRKVERAKRTQFPAGPSRARPRGQAPIVQNKPNSSVAGWGQTCAGTPAPALPSRTRAGRLCKTNPIWKGVGRGRPTYQEPITQNKAKLGQDGTSGGRCPREGPIVRNKANSSISDCGLRIGTRAAAGRPIVQNEPNFAGRPDTPLFQYSIIPPFQSDADCAKRSQFPATPGGTRPGGWGTWGNRVKQSQFGGPIVRNEANFPAWPGGAGPGRRGTWDERQMHKTNPISRRGRATLPRPSTLRPRPRRERLCKTKPNLGELGHVGKGGPRMWGDFAGKWNAQNEPNSSISDCGLGGTPALQPATSSLRRPIVQNEPNFPAGPGDHLSAPRPLRPRPSSGRLCKTKPIARSGAPRRCPPRAGAMDLESATVCRPHPSGSDEEARV